MTFQDIHFLYPSAVYALLGLIPLWIVAWWLVDYRGGALERFASPTVLQQIIFPRSLWKFWGKMGCLSLAWICAVFALMEPISYGKYVQFTGKEKAPPISHDVLFAIDASASMTVTDALGAANRLTNAQSIVEETLRRLHGEQVALYAFTSEATQMSPFTHDYLFVRLMLKQVQKNEGGFSGTHLLDVLEHLHKEYLAPSQASLKTLVVLTDGEDTTLEGKSAEEQKTFIQQKMQWLQNAEKEHLRVFTVGMGSAQGKAVPEVTFQGAPVISRLNGDLLREIAEQGRGKYSIANAYAPIDLAGILMLAIEQDYGIASSASDGGGYPSDVTYATYYQIPLALALLWLALAAWLSNVRSVRYSVSAVLCLWTGYGEAAQEMQEQAQRAQGFLESGEYAQARAIYQEMLQEPLNAWQRAVVMYDLGSSWMGEGEWENALLTLQAVPTDNPLGPVLEYRRSYNYALTFYKKGEDLGRQNPAQAAALLKGFLPRLTQVEEAFCQLVRAEGASSCPPARKVEALRHLFEKKIRELEQMPPTVQSQEPSSEVRPKESMKQSTADRTLQQLLQMEAQDATSAPAQVVRTPNPRPW